MKTLTACCILSFCLFLITVSTTLILASPPPSKLDRHIHPSHRHAEVQEQEGDSPHHTHCRFSDPGFAEKIEANLFDPNKRIDIESPASSSRRAGGDNTTTSTPFETIRISASFTDLYDSSHYCTAAGQTRPDMAGSTRTCSAEEVLTTAKRDVLQNVIIPYAIAKLEKTLLVERFTGNLVVPSSDICYSGFTFPASYMSTGVPNTDYLLMVAAAPDDSNVVAWAGGCAFTNDYPVPRIGIGRTNFNPRYLDLDTYPLEQSLRVGLHEIAHAFGFSHSILNYAGMVRDVYARGRKFRGIVSPLALTTARNFFDCQNLIAVELEDEGGTGTAFSHLNRRMYKNNLMAGTGGSTLSVIELAIFADLGVYEVNFSEADPLYFGRNAGCTFSDVTCPATISQSGDPARYLFCTSSSPSAACTSSLEGYGPCSSSTFLADSCRFYIPYSDANCINPSQGNISAYGESFHADSRCYETAADFKLTGTSSLSFVQRCMQSRCTFANETTQKIQVEFRVGAQEEWQVCTTKNQVINVPGYDGVVKCPSNLEEMCASILGTGKVVPTDPAQAALENTIKNSLKAPNVVPETTNWTVIPNFLTTAPIGSSAVEISNGGDVHVLIGVLVMILMNVF